MRQIVYIATIVQMAKGTLLQEKINNDIKGTSRSINEQESEHSSTSEIVKHTFDIALKYTSITRATG